MTTFPSTTQWPERGGRPAGISAGFARRSRRHRSPSAVEPPVAAGRPQRPRWKWPLAVGLLLLMMGGAIWGLTLAQRQDRRLPEVPALGYRLVNTFPHDPEAFCQGLLFVDGELYESTGLYGRSSLRRVDLETGRVLQRVDLDRRFFGEGITAWNDEIIQLTWREQVAFVYDRTTFAHRRSFRYSGEGWGLTNDGERLIVSDGSSTLRFFDPATFRLIGRLTVRDRGRPLRNINELQYVRGELLANIFHSERIARLCLTTGDVTAWIDLSDLYPRHLRTHEEVLNGIAYDEENDRLFVTGKNWPHLYEIRIIEEREKTKE